MAKLIVHNPPTVELKASGYQGTPTGDIELTENNRTYNVSPFATATTAIPEEEKTVTPSTVKQTVMPDNGLLKKVTVEPTPLESKTVTPSTEQQMIVPQSPAIGFSEVTVEPVTPSIDPDIQPENIKQGVDILGVTGTLEPKPLVVEEKFINFIDYDGILLHSWTEEELQEATELPPLPIKEGYTNLGWNWDLVNLKTQPFPIWVGVYGVKPVNSSSALLYEFNPDDPLDIAIQIDSMQSGKTLTVDYGDGTADTLSANGTFSHTFSMSGKYLVKFTYDGTNFRLRQVNAGRRNIVEAFIGEDTELYQEIFGSAYSLVNLSLSAQKQIVYNVSGGGSNVCLNCWIIPKGVTNCNRIGASRTVTSIPYSVTSGEYVVTGKYVLLNKEIMLHNSITTVGTSMFYGIRNVKTISIPKSVTTIKANAFGGIFEKQNVDLSEYDDPTNIPILENTNAFKDGSSIGSMFVRNQSMLDAFAGATNWSTYANNFIIGGKFGGQS